MTRPNWLTPITATFIASVALSLIAWLGSTVNRDGMLYATTAHAYLDGGFAAAKALFAWPFLPILMAWVAKLTGLDPETAGYVINTLFMAGTCSLMVACIHREKPELAWIASLTVLALPGLNEYRNELLREFGCWFFIMLSFWLALRWHERPTWSMSIASQAALLLAALFRPEALTLYAALTAWQLLASSDQRWCRLVMISLLPLLGAIALIILYWTGHLSERLAGEIGRLNLERFDAKAAIVGTALIEYAHDNSHQILFFGSLALIPIKLIEKFGIFLIPLYFYYSSRKTHDKSSLELLLICAICVYLLVLAVFVTDLQFLAGRYVAPILLFSTPFIALAINQICGRWPRLWKLSLAVGIFLALANVISLSPGKTHLVKAGQWLSTNVSELSTVYIDSGRTAYHAGWRNINIPERNDRIAIASALQSNRYQLFVLEISRHDPNGNEWLASLEIDTLQRFEHPKGDVIIIAKPKSVSR